MSNPKCNFHLYLGKKDYEIIQWKNSLPPKCFKYFVEQILLSYINGHKIMLPPVQAPTSYEYKGTPIHIVVENEQIVSFLSGLDAGQKSRVVKDIILFYIRESQDNQFVSASKKRKRNVQPPSADAKKNAAAQKTTAPSKIEKVVKVEPKQTTLEETISLVEKTEQIVPIVSKPAETTKEKKNSANNPMMQALFKMSGDE